MIQKLPVHVSTQNVAPHDGKPLALPTTYRELRATIMQLQAANGYAMYRFTIDQATHAELEPLETELVHATDQFELRGAKLSDDHREKIARVFEIMEVPIGE